VLAHHLELAGEAARAVSAWQEAAEQARRSAASFETLEHYKRGLAVLATLPESPERDRQELAIIYPLGSYLVITRGPEAAELEAVRARQKELAERAGDTVSTVNALSGFWAAAFVRGEQRTALAVAEQMLEIAERDPSPRPLVLAHADKGACHFQRGELEAAREHCARVLEIYDPAAMGDDPLDRRVLALGYLMLGALLSGRPAEAELHRAQMIATAAARGVMTDLALAKMLSLQCHWTAEQPASVGDGATELEALCAEHKLHMFAATAMVTSGWAMARRGEPDAGLARMREGVRRAQTLGLLTGRATLLAMLSDGSAVAGRLSESTAALDDAFGALGEEELWRPRLLIQRGDLLGRQGDPDGAESAYREAIERAHAMGALLHELRAATRLGRSLQRRGQSAQARALVAPVYERFTEGSELPDLVDAKSLLENLGTVESR
jgi:tetratricopeptide (TPR) repeat protein